MERSWNIVRDHEAEGSARSGELAAALAQVADPELLEKVLWAVNLLDSVGGQVTIAAFRNKYDAQGGRIAKENLSSTPGNYETEGYVVHWDSMAEVIRDAMREPNVKLPADPPPELAAPGEEGGPVLDPIDLAEGAEDAEDESPSEPQDDLSDDELAMHFPEDDEHDAEVADQAAIEAEIADEAEEADAPPANVVELETLELERESPLPASAFAGG